MKRHHFWFVLVLWITIPLVSWGATNNLLENTMSVFVLLSVIFYLKSLKSRRFLMLACAGLMLFLAFLTKGFTGIYPLAFPAICWLFVRNTTFKDMVIDTFVILLFMTLPFVLIWFLSPAAQHFFKKYFTFQIVRSIQSVQTVDSRFYIVFRFFREMILPIVIVGSILLIAVRQKVFKDSLSSTRNRWALAFLFLTLAGVLPIMISLKQSSFYILTVFPLISIGLGLFAESFLENISLGLKFKTVCRVLTICVIIAAIGANVFFAGKIGRDKELLTDIYAILPEMEEHDVITINNDLIVNYSAGAYFYFLKKVSLDPYNHHEYLLCTQPVDDPNYELYRKAPNDLLLYRQTSPEK
jgi:4-amino-4-deoxy-L-arabinose transferase-like glycosyltransferase